MPYLVTLFSCCYKTSFEKLNIIELVESFYWNISRFTSDSALNIDGGFDMKSPLVVKTEDIVGKNESFFSSFI